MQKIITKSAKQTYNLGKKLAQKLKGGEVLALTGELGAGKTVLIKGLAAGLGIKKNITSPTFVLMKVYPITVNRQPSTEAKRLSVIGYRSTINKFVHLDCYRTKNPQEIVDIGATEYFSQKDTVTVIEWADKIKSILPTRQTKKIIIRLKGKNLREITIK